MDDSQINFSGSGSTFNALAAQADNGIVVEADVVTDVDGQFLDGDSENEVDALNTLGFTDGITVSAKTQLTLESSTGSLINAGKLTLQAGNGVMVWDDLNGKANAKAKVMANVRVGVLSNKLLVRLERVKNIESGLSDVQA